MYSSINMSNILLLLPRLNVMLLNLNINIFILCQLVFHSFAFNALSSPTADMKFTVITETDLQVKMICNF